MPEPKKPKKLKDLVVTSVSLVDEGANPRADILITKRKTPADKPTEKPQENIFKRFTNWLKSEGMSQEEVKKQATSFAEQIQAAATEKIQNEIWDVTYALRSSLNSILTDTALTPELKTAAMNQSVSQFSAAMGGYVKSWCSGSTASVHKTEEEAIDVAMMKHDHERLGEIIEKSKKDIADIEGDLEGTQKGGIEEMLKIDKSKMTPEELKAYDEIVKKYAFEEKEEPAPETVPEDVNKGKDPQPAPLSAEDVTKMAQAVAPVQTGNADVQALRAEVEKLRDDNLTMQMTDVAKKYEPLGKKVEDLVPTLKKMKAADQSMYDAYVAALDAQLDMQKSPGIFTEIGKSTSGSVGGDAYERWVAKAKELQKTAPDLTIYQAMDQVILTDDDLRAELDQ